MKHTLFAGLTLATLTFSGFARADDYSKVLTTTPVLVLPSPNPKSSGRRVFLRIVNPGASGTASAWCSRSLGANVAPHAAGAYEIPAGTGGEDFENSFYVPTDPIWCVAETGTVNLTVEAVQ